MITVHVRPAASGRGQAGQARHRTRANGAGGGGIGRGGVVVEEMVGGRREGGRWQADGYQLPPGVRRGAGGGLWPASSSADRRRDTTQPHASRLLQPSAHPSDCSDPNALTTQLQHVPGATTTEIEILCARSTLSSGHTKIRFPTPSRRARAGARRRCELGQVYISC